MLRVLMIAVVAALTGASAFAASGTSEPRYFYWQNKADGPDIKEVYKALRVRPFILKGTSYYDRGNLRSNAVLCGRRADREALRKFVTVLVHKGVKIQFLGSYYKNEFQRFQNAIDLRSVRDAKFQRTAPALTLEMIPKIPWNDRKLCGYDPKQRNWVKEAR